MQNKNLKLKLGLCGLALTSFLAVNTHSVVHADTMPSSNNQNAITWNSDRDDSQVVKEESQQVQPTQPVQAQAPTVQPVQKQATVQLEQPPKPVVQVPKQSTVQASQSQPIQNKKIMVSDVSSTSVSQKRAETSDVRQSNAQTSTVNRLNANNQRAQAKVANVNATIQNTPVQIVNPQNNQVVVHYVNTNGQTVAGVQDTTIDVTKLGKGQYTVPDGYQLVNKGGYTIDDNTSMSQVQGSRFNRLADGTAGVDPIEVGTPLTGSVAYKLAHFVDSGKVAYDILNIYPSDHTYSPNCDWTIDIFDQGGNGYTFQAHRINNDDGKKPITANDIHDISYDDTWSKYNDPGYKGMTPALELTPEDCADFLNWLNATYGSSMATSVDGISYIGSPTPNFANPEAKPDEDDRGSYQAALNMYANKSVYRFTDNSGQVKSATGNHINLQVTQPVPVNDASQIRKSATRIISVNLPDDPAVKDRYKGILNNENQIVQTINFTRSKTIDQLTGATLSETPWSGPSSFPAVTLPDIPGYTMTMN